MFNDPAALSDLDNPQIVSAMKLLQMLTTGLGMFLVPSIIAAILFSPKPATYLGMVNRVPFPVWGYTILIMFASVPLINLMIAYNEQMHLPGFLSSIEEWMKKSEENAKRITEVFLKIDSPGDLFYNLLIIALLPALGEEFLFRGVLQKMFQEMTRNIHLTVFITAALFSAIHMQFYGFLPRMFLGVLFGYLLVWTGSIWVPVLAHFINNSAAVVFAYFASRDELPFNQDTIGAEQGDLGIALISGILIVLIGYGIKRNTSALRDTRDTGV
jgi:membrane protease YdiL (CAAX protease family)